MTWKFLQQNKYIILFEEWRTNFQEFVKYWKLNLESRWMKFLKCFAKKKWLFVLKNHVLMKLTPKYSIQGKNRRINSNLKLCYIYIHICDCKSKKLAEVFTLYACIVGWLVVLLLKCVAFYHKIITCKFLVSCCTKQWNRHIS